MPKKREIRVPCISDDPVAGRLLVPSSFLRRWVKPPLDLFADRIIVEGRTMIYRRSRTSHKQDNRYNLKEIVKFVVRKRRLSCWSEDHKLLPFANVGTEFELTFVDTVDTVHVLIPKFIRRAAAWGRSEWKRFLSELRDATGIAIEEEQI